MSALQGIVGRFRRAYRRVEVEDRSAVRRTEALQLRYPDRPWYHENAAGLAEVIDEACLRLTRVLGLELPPDATCVVLEPEDADVIGGMAGVAWGNDAFVVLPERQLSRFAGIAAHEVAHVLANPLGAYDTPFKGEGFACWAALAAGMDHTPFGLYVHRHTAWLLARGVRPDLHDLWQRDDYSPEVYDLAWSFATYLVARFGRDRYFRFYGSRASTLDERCRNAFREGADALEHGWHAYVRKYAPVEDAGTLLARRRNAPLCSRAYQLHQAGRT